MAARPRVPDDAPTLFPLPPAPPRNGKHAAAPAPTQDEQDFEAWYAAYPRKRKKLDAEKAWKQTRKRRPALKTMLAALELQRDSRDWTKAGGDFIPYPATYLRGGSWADVLPTAEAPAPARNLPVGLDEDRMAAYGE